MAKTKPTANPPTKADAEHYIAIHNPPFHLERRHGNSRLPLVIVPNPGTKFEAYTHKHGWSHYPFWGWDKVIAVVDLLTQDKEAIEEISSYEGE